MKKDVPKFTTDAEEFEFWSAADSTDYFEWSQAEKLALTNLKRTFDTGQDEENAGCLGLAADRR